MTCVVREVTDGLRGYGLLMDVRRTVRAEPQRRTETKASSGGGGKWRMSIH